MYIPHSTGAAAAFITLYVTVVCLHTLGLYLLISVHNRKTKLHNIYLINYSVLEILKGLMNLIGVFSAFSIFPASINPSIWKFNVIVNAFGVTFWQYFFLTYLTIDRLLLVKMQQKYTYHWNASKARNLLLGTWFCGVLGCVATYLCHRYNGFSNAEKIDVYIKMVLDIGFIIIAVVAYLLIFRTYSASRLRVSAINPDNQPGQSIWQIFRRSKFLVAVLLISTFLLFVVVPDLIVFFHFLFRFTISGDLLVTLLFLTACADIANAFFYILLRDEVRKLLLRKIRDCWCCYRTTRSWDLEMDQKEME